MLFNTIAISIVVILGIVILNPSIDFDVSNFGSKTEVMLCLILLGFKLAELSECIVARPYQCQFVYIDKLVDINCGRCTNRILFNSTDSSRSLNFPSICVKCICRSCLAAILSALAVAAEINSNLHIINRSRSDGKSVRSIDRLAHTSILGRVDNELYTYQLAIAGFQTNGVGTIGLHPLPVIAFQVKERIVQSLAAVPSKGQLGGNITHIDASTLQGLANIDDGFCPEVEITKQIAIILAESQLPDTVGIGNVQIELTFQSDVMRTAADKQSNSGKGDYPKPNGCSSQTGNDINWQFVITFILPADCYISYTSWTAHRMVILF